MTASILANMLESDRVATSQVREYISPARLREMLDIGIGDMSATEVVEALAQRPDFASIVAELVKDNGEDEHQD